jgi:hypothetical protein
MKTYALPNLIGKTVSAVIVSDRNSSGPPAQLFFVFDDGSALEVYGTLHVAGSLLTGGVDHVRQYAALSGGALSVVEDEA